MQTQVLLKQRFIYGILFGCINLKNNKKKNHLLQRSLLVIIKKELQALHQRTKKESVEIQSNRFNELRKLIVYIVSTLSSLNSKRFVRRDDIQTCIQQNSQLNCFKNQMQLIPYNQNIYFNASQVDDAYLASICLLAFAYHPIYSNFLYLLYGIGNIPYSSLHLLVRDSSMGSFVQNATLLQNYNCWVGCQIKVTQYLFLIESQSKIGIYSLNTSSQRVNFPLFMSQIKPNNSYFTAIFRHADIFADKYVIFNLLNASNTTVGFGSLGSGIVFSPNIYFSSQKIMETGLSQNEAWTVVNPYSPIMFLYACVTCIYSNTVTNITFNNLTRQINLTFTIPGAYRVYQGNTLFNTQVTNGKIYWGFNSGYSAQKILINQTHSQWINIIFPASALNSTANHQYFFTFGANSLLYAYTFENDTYEDIYLFTTTITKMKISEDSSVLAIMGSSSSWKIQQYQVVQNCHDYNATQSGPYFRNSSLLCVCNYNGSNYKCNSITTSLPASSSSLPITAVIGVVAGLVMTVISIIIIKKNYKRCTKGRRRTPWKYNPIDLMSFES